MDLLLRDDVAHKSSINKLYDKLVRDVRAPVRSTAIDNKCSQICQKL